MKKIIDYLVNENKTDGYISDPRFNTEEDLIAYVRENLGQAVETFLKKNNINGIKIKLNLYGNNRFVFTSTPIDLKTTGILKDNFSEIYIKGNEGYLIAHENKIKPYIKFQVYFFCELKYGADKHALPMVIEGSNEIYYDIVNNVILTDKEAPRQWK